MQEISHDIFNSASLTEQGLTIIKEKEVNEELFKRPYPGLDSYNEEREAFFYGRDKEREEIIELLDIYSVCFLIGTSGIGKSSLVKAGLIPHLKRSGFIPILIRIHFDNNENGDNTETLSEQVKRSINAQIKLVDKDALDFEKDMLLWEYFQKVKIIYGYVKPILIFDQFEEIFTRGMGRKDETVNLIKEIIELAENIIPTKVQDKYIAEQKTIPSTFQKECKVLFVMREDYLPQLTSLRRYLPSIRDSIYRLEHMAEIDAVKSAYLPAAKAHLMDMATAKAIVRKIPASKDSELDFVMPQTIEVEGANKDGIRTDHDDGPSQTSPELTGTSKTATSDEDFEDENECITEELAQGTQRVLKPFGRKIEPFLLNLLCFRLNEQRINGNNTIISIKDVDETNFQNLVESYYNEVIKKTKVNKYSLSTSLTQKESATTKIEQVVIKKAYKSATSIFRLLLHPLNPFASSSGRAIENELITPDGKYRKFASKKEFIDAGKLNDSIIEFLVDKRLIRRKTVNQVEYFELIHDVLIPIIATKRKKRRLRQRILGFVGVILLTVASVGFFTWQKQEKLEQEQALAIKNAKLEQEQAFAIKEAKLEQEQAFALEKTKLEQQQGFALEKTKLEQQQGFAIEKARLEQEQAFAIEKARLEQEQAFAIEKAKLEQDQTLANAELHSKFLTRLASSQRLAAMSEMSYSSSDKIKYALEANDTLYKFERDEQYFVPEVISALLNASATPFNAFWPDTTRSLFHSTNLKVIQEMKELVSSDGKVLQVWQSGSGKFFAFLSGTFRKTLKIGSVSGGGTVVKKLNVFSKVDIGASQNIVSLFIDEANERCIYSTKNPGKVSVLPFYSFISIDLVAPQVNKWFYLAMEKSGEKEIFAINNLGQLNIWNKNLKKLKEFNLPIEGHPVSSFILDPSGYLYIGCQFGKIYKTTTQRPQNDFINVPSGNKANISALAVSSDGEWLAAGNSLGQINLWKNELEGTFPVTLSLKSGEIYKIDFLSPKNELWAVTARGLLFNIPTLDRKELVAILKKSRSSKSK